MALAHLLGASGLFPPLVCHMVAVGENVGALDTMPQPGLGILRGRGGPLGGCGSPR